VIFWDLSTQSIDAQKFRGLDAVVHLAGENIGTGRWTGEKKRRIRDSRVVGTRFLCNTLAQLDDPPPSLIAASAVGYYGERGDFPCDEQSAPGKGFLAEVCVAWEQATEQAKAAGLRVVNLRIGMVLTAKGAALQKMLLPFKMGVGGQVGSGRQYWSWISLDDLVRVILHCLETDSINGPVNAVAPEAVTNKEFTKSLGRALHRPTILPLPAFTARLMLGEMADALLLTSTRVVPQRLQQSGFDFRHPTIDDAFEALLRQT
jgi:hypothetical protein